MIVNKQKSLGQYFTPIALAEDIVHSSKAFFPAHPSILEPAYGQGVFLHALKNEDVDYYDFLGVEIDCSLNNTYSKHLINADFTKLQPSCQYDVVITNPPYTRHHLIDKEYKMNMLTTIERDTQIKLSGLSGLHCYFMLLSDKWLKKNGIGVWLLPAEFLDVNYGEQIKKYLINNVQLLQIHLYDTNTASLFPEATVSSCVVVYRKKACYEKTHSVSFTFGKSMSNPTIINTILAEELIAKDKWSVYFKEKENRKKISQGAKLSDFFDVKRGIATGFNSFFILSKEKVAQLGLPFECFTPIVENTKSLSSSIIEYDNFGNPMSLDRYVLNTNLSIEQIETQYPNLYLYLQHGIEIGALDRYIIKNRKVWYKQEDRQPAPFLCTYISRNNTTGMRFIWNKGTAIATNNFLMLYPKNCLKKAIKESKVSLEEIFKRLSSIDADTLYTQSRDYATGLKKFEPSELGNVTIDLAI